MKAPWIAGLVAVCSATAAIIPAVTWPEDRVVASYATSLKGRSSGQRHNAELAFHRLNGAKIRPGETFSFNHRVGTFSRDQGYRRAPVSYDGQLVSDWGGGVCQSSTTLYNAALLAGMTIVERNHHQFAPGYVEPGRDAAVAFSNIDLRFTNPYSFPVQISAHVAGDCLVVQFKAEHDLPAKPRVVATVRELQSPRTYRLGNSTGPFRVRTGGKAGCEVVVTRIIGNQTEEISHDEYPAMNRVIDTDQ